MTTTELSARLSELLRVRDSGEFWRRCVPEALPWLDAALVDGMQGDAELARRVLLTFVRLVEAAPAPSALYDQWVFDCPRILHICALYADDNEDLVRRVVGGVLDAAPAFLDDLFDAVHVLGVELQRLNKRFLRSDGQPQQTRSELLEEAARMRAAVVALETATRVDERLLRLCCDTDLSVVPEAATRLVEISIPIFLQEFAKPREPRDIRVARARARTLVQRLADAEERVARVVEQASHAVGDKVKPRMRGVVRIGRLSAQQLATKLCAMLPDVGEPFAVACLEAFGFNFERALAALLDGGEALPDELRGVVNRMSWTPTTDATAAGAVQRANSTKKDDDDDEKEVYEAFLRETGRVDKRDARGEEALPAAILNLFEDEEEHERLQAYMGADWDDERDDTYDEFLSFQVDETDVDVAAVMMDGDKKNEEGDDGEEEDELLRPNDNRKVAVQRKPARQQEPKKPVNVALQRRRKAQNKGKQRKKGAAAKRTTT